MQIHSRRRYNMKGDKVIVRSYGGEPKVLRIWEIARDVIFVCSEENFTVLSDGGEGLWPVGVPKEDVFRYNPKVILTDSMNWDQLNVYG